MKFTISLANFSRTASPEPATHPHTVRGFFKFFIAGGLLFLLALASPLHAEPAPPGAQGFQKLRVANAAVPVPAFDTRGGFIALLGTTYLAAGTSAPDPRVVVHTLVDNEWKPSDVTLPAWAGIAPGATEVLSIGGLLNGQPTSRALAVTTTSTGLDARPLPDLPKPVAGPSVSIVGTTLYVVGGLSSIEPPVFENAMWTLDLATPGAAWRTAAVLPGPGIAFAAATEQYGMIALFGGLSPREGGVRMIDEAWTFRPVPLEGTDVSGWKRMADIPRPMAGGSAVQLGQVQVLLLGGSVPPPILPLTPSAPAAGGDIPLCFHTITDAWSQFDTPVNLTSPVACKNADGVLALSGGPGGGAFELGFVRSTRSLALIDYLVIAAYFLLVMLIGFYYSRKQDSSEEFSLGGRKVRWWAAGISMFATGASAISFMAVPALAFSTNLVWLMPVLILIPGFFVTAYFIFPLLRRMNITSTYEYLDRRFNRALRLIASAQCILFQTFGRGSVVLLLPALAISVLTGMNVYLSVLLMGILTTIYTALGGFEAVIWTEVFQGFLKFIAPIAMITVCMFSLPGGVPEFVQTSFNYHKFDLALLTWDVTVPAMWIMLVNGFLIATVVPAGDQPIIQRIFSSPTKEVRRVTAMSMACGVIIGLLTQVLGIAIFCYFRAHPDKFDPTAQNDQIVPLFVTQAMPVGFAGMIVAAIFASAMATVASGMNSVATIFTQDFYLPMRPQATDSERLFVLKSTSYLVGILATVTALLLAALNLKSMMVTWNQMAALLGGGIVGVYSLGMFTKRATGFGAVGGAIVSVLTTLCVKLFTPLHWSTYIPIAIVSCVIAGYFLSLFGPQKKNLDGLTVYTPAPHRHGE